jgi:hypothetical protein
VSARMCVCVCVCLHRMCVCMYNDILTGCHRVTAETLVVRTKVSTFVLSSSRPPHDVRLLVLSTLSTVRYTPSHRPLATLSGNKQIVSKLWYIAGVGNTHYDQVHANTCPIGHSTMCNKVIQLNKLAFHQSG